MFDEAADDHVGRRPQPDPEPATSSASLGQPLEEKCRHVVAEGVPQISGKQSEKSAVPPFGTAVVLELHDGFLGPVMRLLCRPARVSRR
jgi:hypothetical protein